MTRFFLRSAKAACALLLCLLWGPALAATDAAEAIQPCLDCHDYGENAPAHQVLLGSHGIDGDPADIGARRGCLDCHGESAAHIDDPRRHGPDLSFGPRWTASGSAQDRPCLDCHLQDSASDWQNALHMVNNMTCITCHDIHTEQDRVLVASTQGQVCTTCHKAQKSGIHDLGAGGPENPPCSLCHNPHDHQEAGPRMAENASAGCTFCHDAGQMSSLAALNPRAGNFHQAVESGKRACLDCHQGISHAPEDSAPLLHPAPVRGRQVTLFYPGNATREWLTSGHPGSQPLRQGTECALCHRGDEAAMGASLAPDLERPWRQVGMAFSRTGDGLQIDLTWRGDSADQQLAMMWGDDDNTAFRRGGCFAACHDNKQGKASTILSHSSSTGTDAAMGGTRPGATLWTIDLASAEVAVSRLGPAAGDASGRTVTASVNKAGGEWSVRLLVSPSDPNAPMPLAGDQRYTFGVAMHGRDNPGREHWVSLPMTLSLSGQSTDFIVE
ncbi:hypothetical protein F0M18_18375 [Pseudohalioglobus sediminis]|uniref:Cytochrome c-type protein NrfB-like domain-containing protein n=1 Tax=Pseudohalioglobus sediminis TaxID=2606449 RepID=A0A5B0WRA7_9GAMM|nr:cytochrome c3 family protein [Pseudohalioglobus sediminis]KAA1188459.1 hypothetical protein F0M18_18375 [Pseudohalioglobus sediminis]